MREPLATLDGRRFDAVVIGAGVAGSDAARHLAAAGYEVLLAERGDYGSGSSSRSSRLLHCGLRYLAPGDSMWEFARHPGRFATALRMAREAMRCRAQFVNESAERVRGFTFFFPVYDDQPYAPWQIDLGLRTLGLLGTGGVPLERRRLPLRAVADDPLLAALRDHDRLKGMFAFREYRFEWPERIVNDTVREARRLGAVARNYTEVTGLARDAAEDLWRLELADVLAPVETARVIAPIVVNMGGIWIDRINALAPKPAGRRITGAKGVHIMVRLPPACRDLGLVTLHRENEPFYCVPWRGLHYFGPTETVYDGDVDDIRPTEREIEWLLAEANHLVPGFGLKREDVLFAWAGVRPLTYDPAQPGGARDRILHDLGGDGMPGAYALTSQTIMTHRLAGPDVVAAVQPRLAPSRPARPTNDAPWTFPADTNAPPLLDDDTTVRLSDLIYAAEHEQVTDLVDLLFRRTGAGWTAGMARAEACRAAEAVAPALGWDAARVDEEVERYHDHLARHHLGPFPESDGSM